MKKTLFLLATPILLSLMSFSPENMQTQAIPINDHYEFDVSGYYYNSCTGEYMSVSWSVTLNTRGVINDNRANFSIHNRLSGEGVGLNSGVHYIINESENSNLSYPLTGGALSYSYKDRAKIISQGSSANLFLIGHYTFIINANGEVTVSAFDSEVECR